MSDTYRVKELVWTWNEHKNYAYAKNPLGGGYEAFEMCSKKKEYQARNGNLSLCVYELNSIEDAIERCQAHYSELWQSGGVKI